MAKSLLKVFSPVSTEKFLGAAFEVFERPENRPQRRLKPRVSALCDDARQIAYMMANTPASDLQVDFRPDSAITAEQGRVMEDVSARIMEWLGIPVIHRQIELPWDYPLTGHPEGVLAVQCLPGDDYLCAADYHWREKEGGPLYHNDLGDGLVWGWEHKCYGRWTYEDILKKGLFESSPEVIAQIALYGHALGWDACLVTVLSQDASSVLSDMNKNAKVKNPASLWVDYEAMNPKVTLIPVDLRPLYDTVVPALLSRAKWFTRWLLEDGDPAHVAWEMEPDYVGKEFNSWNWGTGRSQWYSRAKLDGQGTLVAPPLPWRT